MLCFRVIIRTYYNKKRTEAKCIRMFRIFFLGLQVVGATVCNMFKWLGLGMVTLVTIFPRYLGMLITYLFSKKKRTVIKKRVGNPKVPFIMMGLSLSIYLIMVFIFSRWAVQNLKIKYLQEDILNSTVEIQKMEDNMVIESSDVSNGENSEIIVEKEETGIDYINYDFDDLIAKNNETVAWIQVNGTKVNYPVVQHDDNDYYLHHDFYGNATDMGWVFGDYRDNFTTFGYNTIIYGHNLINKTMFGSLTNVMKGDWLNNSDNHYIKLSTPSSNTVWKMVSVYEIEPVVDYLKTYFTEDEYLEWLQLIKGRSIYDFGMDLVGTDKIITLSTCNDIGTKRVVVHAKLVKVQYKK